jgi:hypothetical protein
MTIGIEAAAGILTIAFNAGLFIGLLVSKYMSKKECELKMKTVHNRVDELLAVMAGGRVCFELRMVQQAPQTKPL